MSGIAILLKTMGFDPESVKTQAEASIKEAREIVTSFNNKLDNIIRQNENIIKQNTQLIIMGGGIDDNGNISGGESVANRSGTSSIICASRGEC